MICALLAFAAPTTLIDGGTLIDGTGKAGRKADIRIQGSRIIEIGSLKPRKGEKVLNAEGMVVAPGFIDAHSHADFGIKDDPKALSQVTQGITTAVVGQDGIWEKPVKEYLAELKKTSQSINFVAFSGHGGLRAYIMGKDYKRKATAAEIKKMKALLEADMKGGAIGVSSGLEYDPGYYSDTNELIELAKVAAKYKGMYISHVRDEADKTFEAFQELADISKKAGLHAQISHIKLGSFAVWGKTAKVDALCKKHGLTCDVYPYQFWQSGPSALTPSRDWEDKKIWVKAFSDVGGPQNVRLTNYSPDASWVGKTIAKIAEETGRDPVDIIQEIMRKTGDSEARASVAVTAMSEGDLAHFIKSPWIMFSSDGAIGGSHPRGAGTFPRILGYFVREKKLISLPEAIRKMTSLPAATFKLKDRGQIKKGLLADIVVFDPKTIKDNATAENPTAISTGMKFVMIDGVLRYDITKPKNK